MARKVYYISSGRTLAHYASPYYDPQKAHEYYMKNRELKGRATTKGLNEEGRSHAAYIKEQINAERDAKLQARAEQYASDSEQAQKNRDSTIKSKQEAKEKEIADHTNRMKSEIAQLQSKLAGMSAADKRKNSAEIQNEIAKLRAENSAKRNELNQKFGEDKADVQSDYSKERQDMANVFRSDNKAIKEEAVNKYLSELMGLQDSGEFREETKTSGGKSSSESGQKGPAKTTGTLYKSKRLKDILNKSELTKNVQTATVSQKVLSKPTQKLKKK